MKNKVDFIKFKNMLDKEDLNRLKQFIEDVNIIYDEQHILENSHFAHKIENDVSIRLFYEYSRDPTCIKISKTELLCNIEFFKNFRKKDVFTSTSGYSYDICHLMIIRRGKYDCKNFFSNFDLKLKNGIVFTIMYDFIITD